MQAGRVLVPLVLAFLISITSGCPPTYGGCLILPYDDEFNRDISCTHTLSFFRSFILSLYSLCTLLYCNAHHIQLYTPYHSAHATRSNTQHAATRSITQHHAASRSITQHHAAPHSTTQHHAASRSTQYPTYKLVIHPIDNIFSFSFYICLNNNFRIRRTLMLIHIQRPSRLHVRLLLEGHRREFRSKHGLC